MPRKKKLTAKRVNIYLDPEPLEMAVQIENLSKFVQLCLLIAPDIMAWAMLQEYDPTVYKGVAPNKELTKEYNKKYPLDPLTAKRIGKNGPGIERSNQTVDQESNPILR